MSETIYDIFSYRMKLPVRLREVRDFVLRAGVADQITRFAVDIDPTKLKGMLHVYRAKPPYAVGPLVFADVAYSRHLHPYEARMVCCKEMLHLLEGDLAHASTRDKVEKLVEEIAIPPDAAATLAGYHDRTKILHALAVLLPRGALAVVRDNHETKGWSIEKVADVAKLPTSWVRFAMTDGWQEVLHQICGFELDDNVKAAE